MKNFKRYYFGFAVMAFLFSLPFASEMQAGEKKLKMRFVRGAPHRIERVTEKPNVHVAPRVKVAAKFYKQIGGRRG